LDSKQTLGQFRDVLQSHLQAQTDISSRHLQRLFRDFLGVGPKRVIDRFRMFEALDSIHASAGRSGLALGYNDQAHFTRVFKSITGAAPGKYARSQA